MILGILLLVLLISPNLASAQYSTPIFNTYEQSPRSFGAAGAYTSIADDSSAFNLNSAGISRNLEDRSLGANYRIFKKRKEFGLSGYVIDAKTENPLAWGFLFDWARTQEDWHQDFRLGLSFNYQNLIMIGTSSTFTRYSPTGLSNRDFWQYATDVGVLAFLTDFIAVGASAKNVIRTKSQTSPYRLLGGASLNLQWLRVSIEGERNFTQKVWVVRSGLELKPIQSFVVRGGGYYGRYQNSTVEKGYTLGASVIPGKALTIDFGFHDRLQSEERSFVVGLGFKL